MFDIWTIADFLGQMIVIAILVFCAALAKSGE